MGGLSETCWAGGPINALSHLLSRLLGILGALRMNGMKLLLLPISDPYSFCIHSVAGSKKALL